MKRAALNWLLRARHCPSNDRTKDEPRPLAAPERSIQPTEGHRRNSLFYRSERGAEIADMFMSLIHAAARRNGALCRCHVAGLEAHALRTQELREAETDGSSTPR